MKFKKEIRRTTDAIAARHKPVVQLESVPVEEKILTKKTASTYNVKTLNKERPQSGGGKSRVMSALFWSLLSVVGIGLLYSRATISISTSPQLFNAEESISVAMKPQIGGVHALWVDSAADSGRSLYPEYVPLAAIHGGDSLLLSRSDLVRSVSKELYNNYPIDQFRVQDVRITSAEFDHYIAISKPQSFKANVAFTVVLEPIINSQAVATRCGYAYIIPDMVPLENCLKQFRGIQSARITVHPWFALRLPLARAISVEID